MAKEDNFHRFLRRLWRASLRAKILLLAGPSALTRDDLRAGSYRPKLSRLGSTIILSMSSWSSSRERVRFYLRGPLLFEAFLLLLWSDVLSCRGCGSCYSGLA